MAGGAARPVADATDEDAGPVADDNAERPVARGGGEGERPVAGGGGEGARPVAGAADRDVTVTYAGGTPPYSPNVFAGQAQKRTRWCSNASSAP